MRAGPLSNPRVQQLLNNYFVPVFVSDEDYGDHGSAPADEKSEFRRIFAESSKAGFSTGTVHVYVLNGGHPIASLHVATASRTPALLELLEKTIADLKVAEGKALIEPSAQSHAPAGEHPGTLVLHLVARGANRGSWREFPSENWLTLSEAEKSKLLPPADAQVGTSWNVDPPLTSGLLTYFYPQTENNDVSTNRLDRAELKAPVVSIQAERTSVRIDGDLKMKHKFYPHREDDHFVTAHITGWIDVAALPSANKEKESAERKIERVMLVTTQADYAGEKFDACLQSVQKKSETAEEKSRASKI